MHYDEMQKAVCADTILCEVPVTASWVCRTFSPPPAHSLAISSRAASHVGARHAWKSW